MRKTRMQATKRIVVSEQTNPMPGIGLAALSTLPCSRAPVRAFPAVADWPAHSNKGYFLCEKVQFNARVVRPDRYSARLPLTQFGGLNSKLKEDRWMWFFDNWAGIGRVIIVGALAYAGLIALLRISGKRTLTKMNAFDLVVTVALGSTLATIILSRDVALLEGLTAFTLLITLQFVVTWLSVRSERFKHLIKAEPTLLWYRGQALESALHGQRVTIDEIRSAMRAQGFSRQERVEAVILETDGTFSILPSTDQPATTALPDVTVPKQAQS